MRADDKAHEECAVAAMSPLTPEAAGEVVRYLLACHTTAEKDVVKGFC